MFVSKDDFVAGINELIAHLRYEEKQIEFIKGLFEHCAEDNPLYGMINEHVHGVFRTSLRKSQDFTYRNAVISLYGLLENFVEQLLKEFIGKLNAKKLPIAALPAEIRNRHLELSMSLVQHVKRDRSLTPETLAEKEKDIISVLNSFLQESEDYSLNSEAFCLHSANVRLEQIELMFADIGVKGVGKLAATYTKVDDNFSTFTNNEPGSGEDSVRRHIESELKRLAYLRNQIAHGAFSDEREESGVVIAFGCCLIELGVALADILERHIEKLTFFSTNPVEIGTPGEAMTNLDVIGFYRRNVIGDDPICIKRGDKIVAYGEGMSPQFIEGEIESIQVDRNDFEQVVAHDVDSFCLKLSFPISDHKMKKRRVLLSKAS